MKPYVLCGRTTTYANKALNPPRRVTLWKYNSKLVDEAGASQAGYEKSTQAATVQVPTQEQLEQMSKISIAGNKKLFWFDSNVVQGLNRNEPNPDGTIGRGQDWIQFEGIMYNVALMFYEALDDFGVVVGVEDASFNGVNPSPAPMSDYMGADILR